MWGLKILSPPPQICMPILKPEFPMPICQYLEYTWSIFWKVQCPPSMVLWIDSFLVIALGNVTRSLNRFVLKKGEYNDDGLPFQHNDIALQTHVLKMDDMLSWTFPTSLSAGFIHRMGSLHSSLHSLRSENTARTWTISTPGSGWIPRLLHGCFTFTYSGTSL